MASELIPAFALFACTVAVALVYQAWVRRIAHLNLGLFRPYRGDPWPIGVQEDDDARFNWTPVAAAAEPVAAATPRSDAASAGGPVAWSVEDLPAATSGIARVRRVRTRPGDAFRDTDR